MSERIAYPNNWIMAIAWAGSVRFALGHPDITARFEEETGLKLAQSSPLEKMIDEATGYRDHVLEKFVEWHNAEIWGENPFCAEENW